MGGGKLGALLLIVSVMLCILSHAFPTQTSELVPSKIFHGAHHDISYEVLKRGGGGGGGRGGGGNGRGGGKGGGGGSRGKSPGTGGGKKPGGGKNPAPETGGGPSGSGGKGGGHLGTGGGGGGSRRSSGEPSATTKGVTWMSTLTLVMVTTLSYNMLY